MADVTVTAVRSFDYHGVSVNKGSDVTMPPLDAAIEARKGNVSLVSKVRTRAMQAESPEPPPSSRRPRRQYRRRDMTAEP